MSVAKAIEVKLSNSLTPEKITVIDESHHHAGHAGAREGGESHFRVQMVASKFEGMSRVDRQRQIYAILAEEMKFQIHALALELKAPSEI
jgi:BolA family transcriptional regulator, general stress-responsive regulator